MVSKISTISLIPHLKNKNIILPLGFNDPKYMLRKYIYVLNIIHPQLSTSRVWNNFSDIFLGSYIPI